jgi:hypothetical protein
MVEIHVERTIAAPQQQVFDWMADPANLTTAPMALKSGWVKGTTEPGVGASRWLLGAGMWIGDEELTAFDRPNRYAYRIVRAFPPFDHEGGAVTLTPSGTGTHVDWISTYTHPAYAGGRALEAVTSRLLRSGFIAILAGCATALER